MSLMSNDTDSDWISGSISVELIVTCVYVTQTVQQHQIESPIEMERVTSL